MRALSNAKLLSDIEQIDKELLGIIDKNTLSSLFDLKVAIYNSSNKMVYSSGGYDSTLLKMLPVENLSHNDKVAFSVGNNDGIGLFFKGKNENYMVFAWALDRYGRQQLANLRLILIVGFLISTLFIWLPGYFFSGRALKPISKVIKQVDNITASKLNLRVETGNSKDEIAQLATTFNQMLERLDAAFQMQRNFVSNASHELRTPLTAITGQIEVALISPRKTDEYEKILSSLLEDIKSLNTLSNGLLEMTQSNVDISALKTAPLRVDDLLFELQSNFKRRNPDYTININFDENLDDEEKVTIMGSGNLLKSAFGNLIDNACKFSDDKRVEIKISAREDFLSVKFKDWGIGIPENEIQKVFEPFYRAKNSRSKFGHGIGLSLSKKIIELHNGELIIESQENVSTEIEVKLPLINK